MLEYLAIFQQLRHEREIPGDKSVKRIIKEIFSGFINSPLRGLK